MCGIFGYIGSLQISPSVLIDGLSRLEYRGYDSWGIAVISNQKIFIKKKAGKIGTAKVEDLPKTSIAIGHTRWATHGGISDINAHPHLDCKGSIAVVHNGIFENYEIIKKGLTKLRHKFISDTDTEVISHLIEEESKKKPLSQALISTFKKMKGLNAVAAISTKDKSIIAIKNGSPLIIGFSDKGNFISSDASALLPHTKKVYFMENNEMAIIREKSVEIISVKQGKRKKINAQILNWDITQTEKGKYPNFMIKEIYEQPKILSEINTLAPQTYRFSRLIKKSSGTYLLGCGSASYAALAGVYLFSKVAKHQASFALGSEFDYQLDFLNKKSLVIPISQSGETMDILDSVKKAKERGAKIASLTNIIGSSLYRISNYKILIGAGPEKSVASTKALTAMIAHLILIAHTLNGTRKNGEEILKKADESVKDILSRGSTKKIKTLASKIYKAKNIYVVGRGLSYPASLETALKIKEISYIHAEGLAGGELKHGPLALIEKGTPCIVFLPKDETYSASLAGAMEMKARGGFIIGVSYRNNKAFDYFIQVKDAKEATIIPNIVVGQLLAYYLTTKKGLDPDRPRNLAKSVTVK
jgi:glucosamine--fructose-6-phosphate aminotransferase (isomerizing)